MNNSLKIWFEANKSQILKSKLISVHVDQLLGEKGYGLNAVLPSIHLFAELINLVGDRIDEYGPKLVFPLEDSLTLSTAMPSLSELDKRIKRESPSLYISLRSSLQCLERCEEYKWPLALPSQWTEMLVTHVAGEAYCYYRTFRRLEDTARGWEEYVRGIYLEYYPTHLIVH